MDSWKISFIILLALPLAIFANNSKILKKIEENYDTKTFSANFSQTNFWSEIEVEKVSNGKMFYNKEKLILNYSEPVGQQLLLEGKNLSIYDKESNQLIVTKVDNAISKIKPIEIIKYYWQKSEVSISESENMLTAILLPKGDEIKKIEVLLDDFHIRKLKYIDHENNSVSFVFSEEKFNPEILIETFELSLKENVSIIEN